MFGMRGSRGPRLTGRSGGLAAVLVLAAATAALAISLASAEEFSPEFMSDVATPAVISVGPGKGHDSYFTFTNENAKHVYVKCTKFLSRISSVAMPNASLTFSIGLSGCSIGADAATAKLNSCSYQFALVVGSKPPTATMNLLCSSDMTFETATCTIHVPPQNGLAHVVFTNTGKDKKRSVDAVVSASGVKYTITAGCPGQTKNASYANGTITEEMVLTAEDAFAQQTAFWVS